MRCNEDDVEHKLLEFFWPSISHGFKSIVACVLVGEVGLNFYTILDDASLKEMRPFRARLLLDQCKMCNYQCVSLCNEMRDALLVRMSPILGKGRHVY
jgi:hypothetical protein